jgi:hypothetical protein
VLLLRRGGLPLQQAEGSGRAPDKMRYGCRGRNDARFRPGQSPCSSPIPRLTLLGKAPPSLTDG